MNSVPCAGKIPVEGVQTITAHFDGRFRRALGPQCTQDIEGGAPIEIDFGARLYP